jgi:hypothetical protein
VHEEGRLEGLVEGRAERRDQIVRELLDEADRVGDEDARVRLGLHHAHGRVERGEELVHHEHVAAREIAHPGRLAGVRVADQRHAELLGAAGAPHAVRLVDRLELAAELGDAVADLAAIELEGRLAGALAADAAALPVVLDPLIAEPGRHVLQARDLHLDAGLTAAGVSLEDLQDEGGAVEHRDARRLLEVAGLGRRDLVVDDDEVRALGLGRGRASRVHVGRIGVVRGGVGFLVGVAGSAAVEAALLLGRPDRHDPGPSRPAPKLHELARPEDGRVRELAAALRHARDDLGPERPHEPPKLGERRGMLLGRGVRELHPDEDGARPVKSGQKHGRAELEARGRSLQVHERLPVSPMAPFRELVDSVPGALASSSRHGAGAWPTSRP